MDGLSDLLKETKDTGCEFWGVDMSCGVARNVNSGCAGGACVVDTRGGYLTSEWVGGVEMRK